MTLSMWMILMGESNTKVGSAKELMRSIVAAYGEEKNG